MKKGVRLITFLMAFVLCISVIGSAFALYSPESSLTISFNAQGSTSRTLYYFNKSGWTAPIYAYAWDPTASSNTFYAEYPGTQMTAVEGHSGWYSAEIPNEYTAVTFNANDDSKKTGDLTVNESKLYFDGYQWNSFFNAVTLTVNGTTTYQMSPTSTSDTTVASQYTCSVSLNKNDTVTITDENGNAYSGWQNSSEFSGTCNASGVYTFYAKKDYSGTTSIWVGIPTITVYYYNILNWTSVYLHYWGSEIVADTEWPGTAMSAVSGHSGWYSINIACDVTSVIFNNNNGSQSPNLTIDTDNLYFNGYEWTDGFNLYAKTTRTIYFKNTDNWSDVYCHRWGGNSSTTWPGVQMSPVTGHAGWYSVEVDITNTYVIFHNNAGTQTANIPLTHYNWYYTYAQHYSDNPAYGWISSME